jgi:hypothetical protein
MKNESLTSFLSNVVIETTSLQLLLILKIITREFLKDLDNNN